MADVQDSEDTALFERGNVKDLPAEVRLGFIKKVYGTVFYMLIVTFSVSAPFVFAHDKTVAFVGANPWLPMLCGILFVGFYMFNLCMIGSLMCCQNATLYNSYMRMFKTFPQNMVFLSCISMLFGFGVGFICLQYTMESIVFVFFLCAAVIVGLTLFAVKTNCDFTGMGPYLFVLVLGLMLTGVLVSIMGAGETIYAGLGTIVFGFLIVYDTQLIFGHCPIAGANHDVQIQYTVDSYAFAAFQLYLDYINFLIYMLRLLGDRR